ESPAPCGAPRRRGGGAGRARPCAPTGARPGAGAAPGRTREAERRRRGRGPRGAGGARCRGGRDERREIVRYLAGDIGGTNARLALVSSVEPDVVIDAMEVHPVRDYPGAGAVVRRFLDTRGIGPKGIDRAAFGVAGPIVDGRCHATNLAWVVDVRDLRAATGAESTWLLNDLEVMARGVEALRPDGLAT